MHNLFRGVAAGALVLGAFAACSDRVDVIQPPPDNSAVTSVGFQDGADPIRIMEGNTSRLLGQVRVPAHVTLPDYAVGYTTKDSSIAYVDDSGMLIAQNAGVTELTAFSRLYPEKVAKRYVFVTQAPGQIVVEPSSVEVAYGVFVKPTITVLRNGVPVNRAITLRTINVCVAFFTLDGRISGFRGGETDIVVTESGGGEATIHVTVRGRPDDATGSCNK